MLHTIRNITPRLVSFNSSLPSWLLRPFTSTTPAARKDSYFYPDDSTRKLRYKQQAACHRIRYRDDPAYREAQLQRRRESYVRRKNDDITLLYFRLKNWIWQNDWVRDGLPWKTHTPLVYEHKVEHYCHGCDWTKSGGRKMWWRRKGHAPDDNHFLKDEDKSDEYLCPGCYVKHGHFKALPEGYEDVQTIRDIVARKKQLDESAEASSDRSHQ